MKQAIIGFGFFIIFILSVCTVMALGKNNTEEEKLTEAVEVAIYQSLQEGVESNQDPGSLFETNLGMMMSDDTYTVAILQSDYEAGVLSVKVTLAYENFGYERSVSVARSVVYEYDSQ